jgi:release factor glutamine methyltransferase
MTPAQLLRDGIARLNAAGIPGAPRDARLLLAHALGIGADRLGLALGDALPRDAADAFEFAIARRAAREPISHITGRRLFWGRAFHVSADVLDPRPETETLIAACLEAPFQRVLDLGTGSGAIVLTLLAERPEARGLGVDLSEPALRIAQKNARALEIEDRVDLARSDWFDEVSGRFDLIISNPPYVSEEELAGLAPEVRLFEPRMALTPGGDGLDAYRILTANAPRFLTPSGRLVMEIGPTQGADVAGMMAKAGFEAVDIRRDLDTRDRVVLGVWPG